MGNTVLMFNTERNPQGWFPLKVGAGGWVTGLSVSDDGKTAINRTDTYGAYIKDFTDSSSIWRQTVRSDTMPSDFVSRYGDWINDGAYEAVVAPSDYTRLYLAYQKKVYKSTDRSVSWIATGFSYTGSMDANDSYRYWGEKAAVDPANVDIVYVGTVTDGLYVTSNGGTSWALVTDVAVPTGSAGITGIVFDRSGGTSGGKTSVIYAASYGRGVYKTTNGGTSWSLLSSSPTAVSHADVGSDGVYYAATMSGAVWKYTGGSWTNITPDAGQTWHTVVADPFNSARIIVGRDSGHLAVSTNRGTSWGSGIIWTVSRSATDIPWLAWTTETYMSSGAMRFDPIISNKLWFTEGIGVWYCTAPDNASTTAWVSSSRGVEQIVARDVKAPPYGNPVVVGMDRSFFYVNSNTYPSTHGTEATPSASLIHGWSIDYAADDPKDLVLLAKYAAEASGYSEDGGVTWTNFTTPDGSTSGCITAPTLDNIILVVGNGWAHRSTNRGTSWTALTLPGVTNDSTERQNLHNGYSCKKQILAVDRVNIGTIYLYFYGHGLFRSTDYGANWTLVYNQSFDAANSFWHPKLRSVPGQAGHLFFATGQAGGSGATNPADVYLYRSTDGGEHWSAVSGIKEPYDVAVGKVAPGQSYPAIYVPGWYNGVWGIWRSIDNATTWTNLGSYPLNSLDEINTIAANQDVYGRIYVGFQGSGWAYGNFSS
jgi:hypothetical protein